MILKYEFKTLPVFGSVRIFEEIITPNGLNICSKFAWLNSFGRPHTYKLAFLIESELGLANDTFIVLFCRRMPFRVAIALSASSGIA